MSGMKISRMKDARMFESRTMLLDAMYDALQDTEVQRQGERPSGTIFGRLRDIVYMIEESGKSTQLYCAREGCALSAELIADLVRTEKFGTVSLRYAMHIALGSYIEQEAKKEDQWRDESFTDLYKHLLHEIDEIRRSKGKTIRLHNAIDACGLCAMLAIKIEEEIQ